MLVWFWGRAEMVRKCVGGSVRVGGWAAGPFGRRDDTAG